MFAGCQDNLIYLYNFRTTELLDVFNGHTSSVTDIRISKDQSLIFTASEVVKILYLKINCPLTAKFCFIFTPNKSKMLQININIPCIFVLWYDAQWNVARIGFFHHESAIGVKYFPQIDNDNNKKVYFWLMKQNLLLIFKAIISGKDKFMEFFAQNDEARQKWRT